MSEILFYHLERSRIIDVLPDLLQKTIAKGWTATVRTGSADAVRALDDVLWTYTDDSFLPHGAEGKASDHPVWITAEDQLKEDAQILFLVEGATANPEGLGDLERCVLIFDGADADAVADARAFWKAAKEAEHQVTYWKQSVQGRWEQQGQG